MSKAEYTYKNVPVMNPEIEKLFKQQDDYKISGAKPLNGSINMSPSTVAEQKSKLYNEVNRKVFEELGDRLDSDTWEVLMEAINNYAYQNSGYGSMDYQYQQIFTSFEKYGRRNLPPNTVQHGYTFITRPKLNFGDGATNSNNILGLLMTKAETSTLYAIRCMLDTKYCSDHVTDASKCKLVDIKSPFLKLLTNCTRSHSGWPDLVAETYSTEGGYFNEDQTTFLGFDELNRTYDLSIEFEDIQGGHVMALFLYWFLYMSELKRGRLYPYAEDINMRRLCYTCSIYRFLLDPSKQVIVSWAKATGCFPKSLPLGAIFNMNSSEIYVSSARNFSVQFTANKIEYNNPLILTDFNTITRRFYPGIDNLLQAPINDVTYNYVGRPYVLNRNGTHRLVWYYDPSEEPGAGMNAVISGIKDAAVTGTKIQYT